MGCQLAFAYATQPDRQLSLAYAAAAPAPAPAPLPPLVVYLVGCGKTKARRASPGKELYTGNLFRAAREHAERNGSTWRIISARYGLLNPENRVKPYNLTLRQFSEFERLQWAQAVCGSLVYELRDAGERPIEVVVLAGADYAGPICRKLEQLGIKWSCPLDGMAVGERLRYFRTQLEATRYRNERVSGALERARKIGTTRAGGV